MNNKIRREKLKMWKENLKQLEEQLESIMAKTNQAAEDGDLSENTAYTTVIEDTETTKIRIEEIKKIIKDLEGPVSAKTSASKGK